MRILLTGGQGQLGWEMRQCLAALGEVIAPDRHCLDLENPAQAARLVRETAPQVIVNAAAYTAVDKAESEESLARLINALSPGAMAEEARRLGALMVHFSTNYVFDGSANLPCPESHPVSPISAYGRTKAEGEQRVRESGARHLILRSSWIFGARRNNFLLTMLRLAREQDRLRVVADQVGSPSWSRSIAEASTALVLKVVGNPKIAETLNLTSQGEVSWHGFASAILQQGARRGLCPLKPVDPIASRDYPAPARRPAYAVLDGGLLQSRFGIELPPWETALDLCLDGFSEPFRNV